MTIEIDRPELEALIRQRMASGVFRDIDELLTRAISALEESVAPAADTKGLSFAELFEPVQGLLTDEEIDVLFRRDPSYGRALDLS